ncbi:aminotransferase class V-fold PLP-dependent enzyme [Pseudoalteromonas carrageenovora]|uniref:aminotransferase class V-fold PLP-dependent enzyme n=1 Tax=Pseudoalteromonas carrageenovora TaxID=227 RepID=UPI0026E408FB|nr:aminotransferase class V-fold PLP-dependent enzyme [Pseudoalteromonas carrageenovora]MDO6637950.1 aminotransferase class V-fold PLP-dependent enzyme [Pseudoalteromonas carrageenovora]MDO6650249.1 aminotransferase class V-fold PLP-dependent enzyme [Pseudoalteromonas carrageenovora]
MSEFLLPDEPLKQVYLDANATTPVLPCIADVVSHTMQICFGNPSSPHISGIQAKHLLEQTRDKARTVIGAKNGDILFTSGATEGIQTAVVSTLINAKKHTIKNPVLLYGATEHKAVPNTLKHWNNVLEINAQVLAIPVDSNGILDLDFIAKHINNALMICTMAVNNETGVYQDLAAIEQTIRSRNNNVSWMVDCVQALGKQALALSDTTIDYAPFSGHKLYAPKGIGLLYIKSGSAYTPFIAGGGQESGMRSGTENLPGIAGLNKLFSLLLDKTDDTFKSLDTLNSYRSELHEALKNTFGDITFNHSFEHSVPTTLNFAVNDLTSKEVIDLFDAAGIRVSGGSACSTGAAQSFVLDAMGASKWQSENAIRLSFGPAATQQDITYACERIRALKQILQANCLIVSDSTTPQQEVCALGLTQFRHQGACSWLYVSDDKHAVIIDPIIELIPRFEKIANTQNLKVAAVLNTHKHQERESATQLLTSVLAHRVVKGEVDALGWPINLATITLTNDVLEKVATPGHSKDSVSYLLKNSAGETRYCFCGDLILPAGLGNTSLKGGDAKAMAQSILTLSKQLTNKSIICSGHDYQQCFAMNWAVQQKQTPLLSALKNNDISIDEFALQKQQYDALKQVNNTQLCGYVNALPEIDTQQLSFKDAKAMFSTDSTYLIDTREPYEHGATNVAHLFNTPNANTLNIPLSRMANAVFEGQLNKNNTYILLCRSGNRSKIAANNLMQLGYKTVYNLNGGLALSN